MHKPTENTNIVAPGGKEIRPLQGDRVERRVTKLCVQSDEHVDKLWIYDCPSYYLQLRFRDTTKATINSHKNACSKLQSRVNVEKVIFYVKRILSISLIHIL